MKPSFPGGRLLPWAAIAAFTSAALAATGEGLPVAPPLVPAPHICGISGGSLRLPPRSRIVATDPKLEPLARLVAGTGIV